MQPDGSLPCRKSSPMDHVLSHVLGPTQPPIQCVSEELSLGIKRPGRESDHSLQSSAEVKNAWSYTSTPPYVFLVWDFVKHSNNLLSLSLKSPILRESQIQMIDCIKNGSCYKNT
jgi:hypothetical protein